jgi:thiamine pyrophosphokinase
MKALLVCASPAPGAHGLLRKLVADADLTIAVDGGGSLCLSAGVTPDVVLGDFDSLSSADLKRLSDSGASVVRFPADKDESDLELAVAEARRRGATTLVLTAASSGRLDHTLAVLGVLSSAADLLPHLAEPDLDVWALSPTGRDSMVLTGADATISLLPFGSPAVVSTEGAVWDVDADEFDPAETRGLSNRIGPSGSARIRVSSGVVLLFAPQVAGTVRAQGT